MRDGGGGGGGDGGGDDDDGDEREKEREREREREGGREGEKPLSFSALNQSNLKSLRWLIHKSSDIESTLIQGVTYPDYGLHGLLVNRRTHNAILGKRLLRNARVSFR
jgi:hypothetical protein